MPLLAAIVAALLAPSVELKTAAHHPMQYYISLPATWSAGKPYPVVVIIESANREFQATSQLFEAARKQMPFILVTPLVVTNGGPGYRSVPTYHYSSAVWDEIDRIGPFRFDMEGIAAVMSDVRQQFGGEERYFLTGWEAGCHTVWAMTFRRSQDLRAVAPVCPNYQGRGLQDGAFSTDPSRMGLPIRVFHGGNDASFSPGKPLFVQTEAAKSVALQQGFKGISEQTVPGKGHEPLAEEVLTYFYACLRGPVPSGKKS